MGLTIHYQLRLPGTMSLQEVSEKLESLRRFARQSPVAEVSELFPSYHPWRTDAEPVDKLESFLTFTASCIAEPLPDDADAAVTWDEESAMGFVVVPGEGCEFAPIGMMRGRDESGTRDEWYWRAFCKTQYASVVSEAHFVRCHTALIQILDRAKELGTDVVVGDETGYWSNRDERLLIESVRATNRLMAAFGGMLADRLAPMKVEGEIFAHPNFEHLEMGEEAD